MRPRRPVSDLARAGLDTVAVRVAGAPDGAGAAAALRRPGGGPLGQPFGAAEPHDLRGRGGGDRRGGRGRARRRALPGGAGVDGGRRARRRRCGCCGPGAITRDEIERVAGRFAPDAAADAARSPGRLAAHYAPEAPLRLDAGAPEPGEAYLAFGARPPGELVWNLSPRGDLREAAANLFAYLRAADRARPRAIAVAPIPADGPRRSDQRPAAPRAAGSRPLHGRGPRAARLSAGSSRYRPRRRGIRRPARR